MRKFYTILLATSLVAGTAVARTVNLPAKGLQSLNARTVVKKEKPAGMVKNAEVAPVKANLSGKVVTGMHKKAAADASIEGTWTFDLGDFYFESSVGYTTYDFEAFLDGDEVWFEDPYGWEFPFVAKFDQEANTLTFVRYNLGALSDLYVYQQPYIFSWDILDIVNTESIVGTYYPEEGVILFDEDNGLAWEACSDEAGTDFLGWYSIYDLVGATLAAEAEPIDEVQEGQWKSVGMAKFVDAWIMPSYSIDGVQIDPNEYAYEVELQQNVENENVYRLWKPYANSILAEVNRSTYEGQIVFDISDPDHVMVIASGMPAGFKNNYGEFYLTNELAWWTNYYEGYYDKDFWIDYLYGGEPADTYKDGVVTILNPTFDFSNRYEGGNSWINNPYYAVITFPEPELETIGTYDLSIQPTDIYGEKTGDAVDIQVEVKRLGDDYWMAELGSTNYFNDQVIPFTYNEAKMATFTASYAGEFDGQHTWFSPFIFTGMVTEPQATYGVTFDAETGFEFPGNSGFGWFITEDAESFDPWDVYAAFYVLPAASEGDFADASIEGEWNFTLNGHYLGSYSLGEFTEQFTATLDGNTVTFASSGSPYNIVAEFTAENTLTFTKCAVGNPATYTLWQSPYLNTAGVDDIDELSEDVFTATYDPEAGTITFPANSGLRYGYFSAEGTLSYWDDAFDFVAASKEASEPEGEFADASIVGEWSFTVNDHFDGSWSRGVVTETYTATLDGNTVRFTSEWDDVIIAEFTAENTLTFNVAVVGDPTVLNPLSQYPYIDGPKDAVEGIDLDAFVFGPFTATYDPEAGTIAFPEGCGLAFIYANGNPFMAFDLISASRTGGEVGIDAVVESTEGAKVLYYDLSGRIVSAPKAGIYVKKTGNSVQKVVVE